MANRSATTTTPHAKNRFMTTVNRIGNRVKAPHTMRLEEISGMEIDAKVELIQTLIPLGLMYVEEELMRVEQLAGPRHSRGEGLPGHVRWAARADRSTFSTRRCR